MRLFAVAAALAPVEHQGLPDVRDKIVRAVDFGGPQDRDDKDVRHLGREDMDAKAGTVSLPVLPFASLVEQVETDKPVPPAPVDTAKPKPAKLEAPTAGQTVPTASAKGSEPVDDTPTEEASWSIFEWGLCATLVVLVLALILVLFQTSGEKAAVRSVMAAMAHTPLSLMLHREFQVVKTAGYVELDQGERAKEQRPLVSPVSQQPCAYYHALVEVRTPTGWEIVDGSLFASTGFLLSADGVQVLVEIEYDAPAILEFTPTGKCEGDFAQLPTDIQVKLRNRPGAKLPANRRFRVTEWSVREGDHLQCVGLVVRRVRKKVTRTALAPGGLSASNASNVAALFSLATVGRWHQVGNSVLLARA